MADEVEKLRREEDALKRGESEKRAEQQQRGRELKGLQAKQRQAGKRGQQIGGEVGGRAGQLGGTGVGAGGGGAVGLGLGIAGAPFTGGTSLVTAPLTGARLGATVGGQAGYAVGKYGVGRPLGKQVGKAPYRPLVARKRHQMRAAGREADELRAARREVAAERGALEGGWLRTILTQAERAVLGSAKLVVWWILSVAITSLFPIILFMGFIAIIAVIIAQKVK